MASLVVDIIDRAHAKSDKNRAPGDSMVESEQVQAVTKAQRAFWAIAAKVNPAYFGVVATLDWSADLGGWTYPAGHEATARIEFVESGTEIVEVPFDNRQIEAHLPAVYTWGRALYSRGTEGLDPSEVTPIRMFFTGRPTDPPPISEANTEIGGATLDERWPEQYDEALVLAVAIDLATKDSVAGRDVEAQKLRADLLDWLKLFVAHVETERVRRRFPPQPMTQQRLLSLAALLPGGAG